MEQAIPMAVDRGLTDMVASTGQRIAEVVDGSFKSLFQRNGRLPSEHFASLPDVGLASCRIVGRERVVLDRAIVAY